MINMVEPGLIIGIVMLVVAVAMFVLFLVLYLLKELDIIKIAKDNKYDCKRLLIGFSMSVLLLILFLFSPVIAFSIYFISGDLSIILNNTLSILVLISASVVGPSTLSHLVIARLEMPAFKDEHQRILEAQNALQEVDDFVAYIY